MVLQANSASFPGVIYVPIPTQRSRNQPIGGQSPLLQRRISKCFCRSRLRPAIPRCARRAEISSRKNLRFFRDFARKKWPPAGQPAVGRPVLGSFKGSFFDFRRDAGGHF